MSHGEEPDYDDRDDHFDDAPPPKRGMSGGKKILLILLCIFGGIMLLCCGAGAYLFNKVKNASSDDPVVIKRVTQEIVTIDVPGEFNPMVAVVVDVPVIPKVKMVVYQGATEDTTLMLMQLDVPPDEVEQGDVRQKMREQGGNAGELRNAEVMPAKEFVINGKTVQFDITKGVSENTNEKVVQIQGVFQGKDGMVILLMQIPEQDYKEENVVQMLKSIK